MIGLAELTFYDMTGKIEQKAAHMVGVLHGFWVENEHKHGREMSCD